MNKKRKPGLHSSLRWLAFICENKKAAKINGLSIMSKKKKTHQRLASPPLSNSFSLPIKQSKWTTMFLLDPGAWALSPSTTASEVIEKELLLRLQYSGPDIPSASWLQNEYSQTVKDWRERVLSSLKEGGTGQLSRGIGQPWTFGSLGLSKKVLLFKTSYGPSCHLQSNWTSRIFSYEISHGINTAGLSANVISPGKLG